MQLLAPRTWSETERRLVSLAVLCASAVLLVAILVAAFAGRAGIAIPLGFLLVLLLGVQVAALVTDPRGKPAPAPAAPVLPEEDPDEGPPVLEEDVLSVRCGRCGTVFDITDTGERPLRHACPGCGAAGFLDEPQAAQRHVRLRCPSCGHLDRIADPGTRPLVHRCPACGRLGRTRSAAP